ncbi:MAG: adenylate/guanylate cyclase domain-containing protein [Candidatus Rokubacteria bacterium]|nr:adenylate/guanylate cyclase domain-containing protein [Candidatus Rokubacteria bacterium]
MYAETRYAKSCDVHIAYQVTGSGPFDLVFVPGFVSHVELQWEDPRWAHFLTRLGSFCRLIRFDKRGTGLSDRVGSIPTLEERMDDARAVMDAVGSNRAALLGISEGGPMCALFAATYPERTSTLIMYGAMARYAWAPDHPWGRTREEFERRLKAVEQTWGMGADLTMFAPSLVNDDSYRKWWATYERAAASPGAVMAVLQMNWGIDARPVLPAIRVPTLVLHRTGDRVVKVEQGRLIAERIPGAKYVELPGDDHVPSAGDADTLLDEIEEFLTGVRHGPEPDRVLATVLFTDIVGATERAAELGDRRWRELIARHHALVRKQLERYHGREIDTAGDGFLAAFDGPARAIRCAGAIGDAVGPLGIRIRAGLHTGECEVIGGKLGGIAVHIGARVAALAAPDEVLVSSTVKDLVAGSGLRFQDRGVCSLRGVPGEWRLFAVERVER